MPFVHRDASGAILAVSQSKSAECNEQISSDDPALVKFLAGLHSDVVNRLRSSDQGFIRVLEDVVDLLVEKELIRLADLPQDARDKIQQRKALRRELQEGGRSG